MTHFVKQNLFINVFVQGYTNTSMRFETIPNFKQRHQYKALDTNTYGNYFADGNLKCISLNESTYFQIKFQWNIFHMVQQVWLVDDVITLMAICRMVRSLPLPSREIW